MSLYPISPAIALLISAIQVWRYPEMTPGQFFLMLLVLIAVGLTVEITVNLLVERRK